MRFRRRAPRPPTAAQRGGPGLRRGGLPADCLDSLLAQTRRRSRSSSSTTARPTAPARSPSGTPRRSPGPRGAHRQPRPRAPPATRACGTRRGELLAFRDSDDVRPARRRTRRMVGSLERHRAPTSSPARSCAGRATACTSRRGCGGCTRRPGPGPGRRAPRDPGRRLRVEQGVPPVVLGRGRAVLARGGALRGPADHDARLPRRHGSTCSRESSTTGGSAPTAPRSPSSGRRSRDLARPLGDQADGARRGEASTTRTRPAGSSSTGCWPATCTATSC